MARPSCRPGAACARRVNGVIQYAPPSAAREPLPSESVPPTPAPATVTAVSAPLNLPLDMPADVNAAAVSTVNGVGDGA